LRSLAVPLVALSIASTVGACSSNQSATAPTDNSSTTANPAGNPGSVNNSSGNGGNSAR